MADDIIHSDIPINLNMHPVTGDLIRIVNTAAITQSVKNIVLTNKYERFWDAEKGSSVSQTLFDNAVSDTEITIQLFIKTAIERDEPRATNVKVIVIPNFSNNRYECTIEYTPINTLQTVTFDMILNRVR